MIFLDEKPRFTFANFLQLFIQGPPLTHSALIGWGTAGDMTVSLSGAGVEGVVVKVAIGDGSWREVGEAGGGGVVVGGPEVGRPALEVGGGGAYLRVANENFAIVQKNCSLLKRI